MKNRIKVNLIQARDFNECRSDGGGCGGGGGGGGDDGGGRGVEALHR